MASALKNLKVGDIMCFFGSCARAENDKTNKLRETILKNLSKIPESFRTNEEHGKYWTLVINSWNETIQNLAKKRNITYTGWKTSLKGGRSNHYDLEVIYMDNRTDAGRIRVEFKYGSKKINNLPQFLSLQAKHEIFEYTYETYYYENGLKKYVACDKELAALPLPEKTSWQKDVRKVKPATAFFKAMYEREGTNKAEKAAVSDESITSYLEEYGSTIDTGAFEKKVQDTQRNKIYLLWCDGEFHEDSFTENDMTGLNYKKLKNGNTIVLEASSGLQYHLLLRWRNHKGILNPAWQIAAKRPAVLQ